MKYLKIGLGVMLPSVVVLSVILLPSFIPIDNLSCRSQFGPCNPVVEKELDSLKGKSLRGVAKSLKQLLANDSTVEKFSYQFKLPSTLRVNLIENKATFAVKSSPGQFYLVDSKGVVIKITEESNLPFINSDRKSVNTGEVVAEAELFSLKLISDLFAVYQIREGSLAGESFSVVLPQGQTVIFPVTGDRELLLGALSAIVSRLNGEAKDSTINVSVIDLRFKNPILK